MPTIDFLWDEWSDNVLQETDENNVVTTYFQRPEKYGEVLYHKAGSRFSFYHFDGNGSTQKLTNVSQSTIKTFIISAFGELVASSGTGSTPFAYKGAAGYYTNPVTNDIYVRARTYEPTTGRWLSKDPLGFVDGPNLYGAYFVPYAIDPSGLLTVINVGPVNADQNSCDPDSKAGAGFDWQLDNVTPIRGYIIQRVEFTCKTCDCGTCGECLAVNCTELGPFVYYEAWVVEANSQAVPLRNSAKNDTHRFPAAAGHCIESHRHLEARFFQTDDDIVSDFGWNEPRPQPNQVVYGAPGCLISPGELPSIPLEPPRRTEPVPWRRGARKRWNNGEREFSMDLTLKINCCDDPSQNGGTFEHSAF